MALPEDMPPIAVIRVIRHGDQGPRDMFAEHRKTKTRSAVGKATGRQGMTVLGSAFIGQVRANRSLRFEERVLWHPAARIILM